MRETRTYLKIRLVSLLKLVAGCYELGFLSLHLFEGIADMFDGELSDDEIDTAVEAMSKDARWSHYYPKTWRNILRTWRDKYIDQTKQSAPATE